VTRYGRAQKVEGSVVRARPPQPHPDANRDTRRMPFEQLRTLVVSLIEPESADDDDPVAEFDTQPTVCLPGPRTSTLDQLIAALPRYDSRMARGSTASLRPETEPTVRSVAYTACRPVEPSRPATPRRAERVRTAAGRGSPRR
jgi:hypothetical protein